MKQCPKCNVLIGDHGKFHRHVKDCLILNKPVANSLQWNHGSKRKTTSSRQPRPPEKLRFQCPYCPKLFSRKWNCDCHVKQKHTDNPERCLCPHCSLSFTQKVNCQRHIRQQHSINPLRFPCTIFGQVCS